MFFYALISLVFAQSDHQIPIKSLIEQSHRISNLERSVLEGVSKSTQEFNRLHMKLDQNRQREVVNFFEQFEELIPHAYLLALAEHFYLRADQKKVRDTVKLILLYKYLLALESHIIHFNSSSTINQKNADLLYRLFPVGNKISPQLPSFLIHSEVLSLIELLSEQVASHTSHRSFLSSLKQTDAFMTKELIPSKKSIISNFSGPLLGNQLEVIEQIEERLKISESILVSKFLATQLRERLPDLSFTVLPEKILNTGNFAIIDPHKEFPEIIFSLGQTHDSSQELFLSVQGPIAAYKAHSLVKELREISSPLWQGLQSYIQRENYALAGEDLVRPLLAPKREYYWLQTIERAERSLYVRLENLTDPFLVDALIRKKLQESKMDIRIILSMGDSSKDNYPNVIFLQQLDAVGIELVGRGSSSSFLEMDYIIQDEETLIADFNFAIYNFEVVQSFRRRFIQSWVSLEKSQYLNIEDFRVKKDQDHSLTRRVTQAFHSLVSYLIKLDRDKN